MATGSSASRDAGTGAFELVAGARAGAYKRLAEELDADAPLARAATDRVAEFVRERGLVLYGGQAIDFALRATGIPGAEIYPETQLPDYDFYSPDFAADAFALAQRLADEGFPAVRAGPAIHVRTVRVRTDHVWVADVSSAPAGALARIPTREFRGLRFVHPDVQRIDLHLSLARPYLGAPLYNFKHRWAKDLGRLLLFQRYCPVGLGEGADARLGGPPAAAAREPAPLSYLAFATSAGPPPGAGVDPDALRREEAGADSRGAAPAGPGGDEGELRAAVVAGAAEEGTAGSAAGAAALVAGAPVELDLDALARGTGASFAVAGLALYQAALRAAPRRPAAGSSARARLAAALLAAPPLAELAEPPSSADLAFSDGESPPRQGPVRGRLIRLRPFAGARPVLCTDMLDAIGAAAAAAAATASGTEQRGPPLAEWRRPFLEYSPPSCVAAGAVELVHTPNIAALAGRAGLPCPFASQHEALRDFAFRMTFAEGADERALFRAAYSGFVGLLVANRPRSAPADAGRADASRADAGSPELAMSALEDGGPPDFFRLAVVPWGAARPTLAQLRLEDGICAGLEGCGRECPPRYAAERLPREARRSLPSGYRAAPGERPPAVPAPEGPLFATDGGAAAGPDEIAFAS